MKSFLLIFLMLLVSHAFADEHWGHANNQFIDVSPFDLISSGNRYDGWKVRVTGIAHFDSEYGFLFVSRERYELFDTASSFAIDANDLDKIGLDRKKLIGLAGKFVSMEGVYEYMPKEKLKKNEFYVGPSYVGSLKNITYLSTVEIKKGDKN